MRRGKVERKVTALSFPGGGKGAELNFKKSRLTGKKGRGTQPAPGPLDVCEAPRRLHDSAG